MKNSWAGLLVLLNRIQLKLISAFCSVFFKIYCYFHPAIKFHSNIKVSGRVLTKIHPKSTVRFGELVRINSGHQVNPFGGHRKMLINVNEKGVLSIGRNVGISSSTIICTNCIEIGDDVLIGGDCAIFDTDFHAIDFNERMQRPDLNVASSPIVIGAGAFIGGGTFILKGVTIGKRAVVGSRSVVTKNVPDLEVWAGNPAKFIRKLPDAQ